MTSTLSQKLFTQRDGKRFAYANEIKKSVKELNNFEVEKVKEIKKYQEFPDAYLEGMKDGIIMFKQEMGKIFGKELSE